MSYASGREKLAPFPRREGEAENIPLYPLFLFFLFHTFFILGIMYPAHRIRLAFTPSMTSFKKRGQP